MFASDPDRPRIDFPLDARAGSATYRMKHIALFLTLIAAAHAAEPRAKNVILFLGDAGGIPTLSAASLYGYGAPEKLFIQRMPNIALMNTSAADSWVTDSAAGMSAIVTGRKTNNGVLSQSADGQRGAADGRPVKTILEYAEERGLSTGLVSNMSMVDATPAACYSHVNDRGKAADIFAQLLAPRFGDGVDVVIGGGRTAIFTACERAGWNALDAVAKRKYALSDGPDKIASGSTRVLSLTDQPFQLATAASRAVDILSRNPKGFFLMIEWDMHTKALKRGLDNAVELDNAVRAIAERSKGDTLIIFTADHSYDLRMRGGKPGEPLVVETADGHAQNARPVIRVEDAHTGEEVLAAGMGPGAERIRGFLKNTDMFHIMMSAYGWPGAATEPEAAGVAGGH